MTATLHTAATDPATLTLSGYRRARYVAGWPSTITVKSPN